MKKIIGVVLGVILTGAVVGYAVLWSGAYNVAADDPHTMVVYRLLEGARERSAEVRAAGIQVPDLTNPELLRGGAGNYAAMCEDCHLRPGLDDSELHRGLYPQPSDLVAKGPDNPAEAFWIIKHGLKATGMAAWGRSMDDEAIWGMVAFLRWIPGRTAAEYEAAVAASSGHSHADADEGADDAEHSQDAASAIAPARPTAWSPADRAVISALEAYHAALTSGDVAAVERLVTPDDRFIMIEGDHVNLGWADYRDHHLSGELGDLGKVRFRLTMNHVQQNGARAYVSFAYSILPKEGPERDFGSGMATAVLVKTDAGWKIQHLQTS